MQVLVFPLRLLHDKAACSLGDCLVQPSAYDQGISCQMVQTGYSLASYLLQLPHCRGESIRPVFRTEESIVILIALIMEMVLGITLPGYFLPCDKTAAKPELTHRDGRD